MKSPSRDYCMLGLAVALWAGCGTSHDTPTDGGIDGAVLLPDGRVVGPDGAGVFPDVPDSGGNPIPPDGSIGVDVTMDVTMDPDAGPRVGGIGTPCVSNDDCDGRFCAPGLGYCTWNCAEDVACPGGEQCVMFGGTVGLCVPGCDRDDPSTCAPGFACLTFDPTREPICLRGCDSADECPEGSLCQPGPMGGGRCHSPGVPEGSPCESDAECSLGTSCADELRFGFSAGMCVARCNSVGACSGTTSCVPSTNPRDPGLCLPLCDGVEACRTGYSCEPGPTEGALICLPRCRTDAECSPSYRCEFLSGKCVYRS